MKWKWNRNWNWNRVVIDRMRVNVMTWPKGWVELIVQARLIYLSLNHFFTFSLLTLKLCPLKVIQSSCCKQDILRAFSEQASRRSFKSCAFSREAFLEHKFQSLELLQGSLLERVKINQEELVVETRLVDVCEVSSPQAMIKDLSLSLILVNTFQERQSI